MTPKSAYRPRTREGGGGRAGESFTSGRCYHLAAASGPGVSSRIVQRVLPRRTLGLIALVLAGEAFAACFPLLGGLAGSGGAPAGTGDETATTTTGTAATTASGTTSSTAATTTAGTTTSTSTTSGAGGCGANLSDDPHNCGACGHDCLGGDCVAGSCQPVVFMGSQPQPIRDLAGYDGAIYWVTGNDSLSFCLEDCQIPPTTLNTVGGSEIAVGPGFVYVGAQQNKVTSVAMDGGAIATVLESASTLREVAVDSSNAYFSVANHDIYRTPLPNPIPIPPDGGPGPPVLTLLPDEPWAIAVDDKYVYAAGYNALYYVPKSPNGGTGTAVSDAKSIPTYNAQHIAVDGEGVVWAIQDGGAARYSVVPPVGLVNALLDPSMVVTGIAAEPGHVYVTVEGGTVGEVPSIGGTLTVLAPNQLEARLPVVTAIALYWVAQTPDGDDAIMRLAK
jgi:hypothetical protein